MMGMVGAVVALCGMWCCRGPEGRGLETALHAILADAPAQVGVAVIIDGKDTVVVNNDVRYPLMSVFKLHQAIAVCGALDASSRDLDLIMPVASEDLDRNTWSPLAESCPEGNDSLTVGEMMDYLLRFSDNNVSNILFDRICTIAETDSFIRQAGVVGDFRLEVTERQMHADHGLSYRNWSSPLACAVLVDRVFTDSLVSAEKQAYIRQCMEECDTGRERIAAALTGKKGVVFAHRTGSGYVNDRGQVIAVNDVGYVSLPDGRGYAIAVLVRDYGGPQSNADSVIAAISAEVYDYVSQQVR